MAKGTSWPQQVLAGLNRLERQVTGSDRPLSRCVLVIRPQEELLSDGFAWMAVTEVRQAAAQLVVSSRVARVRRSAAAARARVRTVFAALAASSRRWCFRATG